MIFSRTVDAENLLARSWSMRRTRSESWGDGRYLSASWSQQWASYWHNGAHPPQGRCWRSPWL